MAEDRYNGLIFENQFDAYILHELPCKQCGQHLGGHAYGPLRYQEKPYLNDFQGKTCGRTAVEVYIDYVRPERKTLLDLLSHE